MKKINKIQARKLYNEGKIIHLLPCKMRLDNMWQHPCPIDKTQQDDKFDTIVNYFEYYNCCYELGYYASYYIED